MSIKNSFIILIMMYIGFYHTQAQPVIYEPLLTEIGVLSADQAILNADEDKLQILVGPVIENIFRKRNLQSYVMSDYQIKRYISKKGFYLNLTITDGTYQINYREPLSLRGLQLYINRSLSKEVCFCQDCERPEFAEDFGCICIQESNCINELFISTD